MQNINVKIHDYNENSQSLIVSFSSDTSKKSLDEYPKYAIPINLTDKTDINDLLEVTALGGIQIVEKQNLLESETFTTEILSNVKDFVGKEFEFKIEDLKAKFKPE